MASQNSEAVAVRLPVLQQEESYKHWRNAILMWSLITDVEPEKQALVVALNLSGNARKLALNIDSSELNKKNGMTTLLNLLDEQIQGLDAYSTFQKLDNLRMSPLQSTRDYVDSFQIFYASVEIFGSSIPDKILAYKLLNGSGLSQERQEKVLETTEVISVAGIRAALLSAGNWPRTKALPETKANGSKQLQSIFTQPNQSQQLRTQASSLSNISSKFSFSVASADSTVKVTEFAASASTKDISKNIFPGFSSSATSLKKSSNGEQEVKSFSNPLLKNSLKKTNKGVVAQSLSPAKSEQHKDPSATDNSKQLPATGPLKVDKKPGKWNCSDCYTENEPTEAVCHCCGKANPNAPVAPKAESTGMKPVLFSFGLNQKTSHSFGIQQTTPNPIRTQQQEIKLSSNEIVPPKFSFGQTSGEMPMATKDRTKANPIVHSFGSATNPAEASAPQTVQSQAIDSITEGMLVTKKEAGSWNCLTCYSPNLAIDLQCPCCYTPNPNAPKTDAESTLKQKPTSPVCSLTPLVAQHTESLWKSPVENILQDSIFETPQKPRSLGSRDNKFSFHIKLSNIQENDNSSKQQREHTISACSDDPQAEKDIHFEPIVQLPEKVELVTGEEDEQVIFGSRAKLYSFHKESKQWKERGLGEVKILQNLSTFKVRVVMRREQVFKVCLNHLIKTDYNLIFKEPTAGKTLLWTARDFSDVEKPDGEVVQFALRFKSTEIANSFKFVWEYGGDAAAAKTLLDPDPSYINTSMMNSGATSPWQVVQSPTTPVKQPTSTFSFTNIPSPFNTCKRLNKGPVNVMGFVFGKPPKAKSASSSSDTFDFDISKLSFNFTETRAPQFPIYPTTSFNQWR